MDRLKAARSALPHVAIEAAAFGGFSLITYGAWQIYRPAGFIVAGVTLLGAAWLGVRALGRGGRSH